MPKRATFSRTLEGVETSPAVTAGEMRTGLLQFGIDVTDSEASSMVEDLDGRPSSMPGSGTPHPVMRLATTAAAEANRARISRDHVSVGDSGMMAVKTPGPAPRGGVGPEAHQDAEKNKRHLLADHLFASDRGITAENTPKARAGEAFLNSAMRVGAHATLEATQGQILSQSPTDAT